MSDSPGIAETLQPPLIDTPSLPSEPLPDQPNEFFTKMNSLLVQGAKQRGFEQDDIIGKGFSEFLNYINRDYKENVVNLARGKGVGKDFNRAFQEWYNHPTKGFVKLPENLNKFQSAVTPEKFQRLTKLMKNLNHDALLVLQGIYTNLDHDEKTYLNTYAIEWPAHVLERVSRQMQEQPVVESFDPHEVMSYLDGLFDVLSNENPHFQLSFDIDPQIQKITSDKLYFEGAVFNLIRNAQVILQQRMGVSEARVKVSMKLDNGQVVLSVQDNGGGFQTDDPNRNLLLTIPKKDAQGKEIKDKDGNPRMIQKAFMRGETSGTGGTGLGLDIVREVTEDHLHGSVSANNVPFPETEQMGARVEMRFPYT